MVHKEGIRLLSHIHLPKLLFFNIAYPGRSFLLKFLSDVFPCALSLSQHPPNFLSIAMCSNAVMATGACPHRVARIRCLNRGKRGTAAMQCEAPAAVLKGVIPECQ